MGFFWIQSARNGRLEVSGKNLGHQSYDVILVMFVAVRIGVSLESNYEEVTLLKILHRETILRKRSVGKSRSSSKREVCLACLRIFVHRRFWDVSVVDGFRSFLGVSFFVSWG